MNKTKVFALLILISIASYFIYAALHDRSVKLSQQPLSSVQSSDREPSSSAEKSSPVISQETPVPATEGKDETDDFSATVQEPGLPDGIEKTEIEIVEQAEDVAVIETDTLVKAEPVIGESAPDIEEQSDSLQAVSDKSGQAQKDPESVSPELTDIEDIPEKPADTKLSEAPFADIKAAGGIVPVVPDGIEKTEVEIVEQAEDVAVIETDTLVKAEPVIGESAPDIEEQSDSLQAVSDKSGQAQKDPESVSPELTDIEDIPEKLADTKLSEAPFADIKAAGGIVPVVPDGIEKTEVEIVEQAEDVAVIETDTLVKAEPATGESAPDIEEQSDSLQAVSDKSGQAQKDPESVSPELTDIEDIPEKPADTKLPEAPFADIKAAGGIVPVVPDEIISSEISALDKSDKSFSDYQIQVERFQKSKELSSLSQDLIVDALDRNSGDTADGIAVLPFDNFSNDDFAVDRVMPALIQQLHKRGLPTVGEERLLKFLCSEGVRATGFVPGEVALKAQKELQVRYIMAGAVVNFSTAENPEVGILARLIDASTGFIVWADYASITGEDFTQLLGRGKIKDIDTLIDRVVEKLFAAFSTVPPAKDMESTYTVAVMPFQNKSEYPYAGKIATYMFIAELFQSTAFTPVEFGDIRKFVVDFRIRNKGDLDYRSMDAALDRLRVGSVLVGSVDDYIFREEPLRPPRVVMTARLLDAGNKKILWYNSLRLDGAEDIIAFDWGRIRTVDKVAHKTVSELVKKMEKTEWFNIGL